MNRVRVSVPGSIGNVGPGLDILGLAVTGASDQLLAERTADREIVVADPGDPTLPTDPERHTSAVAARAALAMGGRRGRFGLVLRLTKGLPLSGGQGGSAASAVAGAVAANALMGSPLGPRELMAAALEAEVRVAGRHLDNIAPSLLGGLALVLGIDPIEVVPLPVPRRLVIVLGKPSYGLDTKRGRAALPAEVTRATALYQAARIAAMVAAAQGDDLERFGRAIDDRIAEPARTPLLPGFAAAKAAALEAGAFGASISGSGPTIFAVTVAARAPRVAAAISRAYRAAGFAAATRIARADRVGARVR